jgi:hypothetical protein
MGILEKVIDELNSSELDQQVRELSDMITQEERGGKEYDGPDGPNVFLSLNVVESKNKKTYITLEREGPENYIIGVWTRTIKKSFDVDGNEDGLNLGPLLRLTVWELKEDKANKILKIFAEKFLFLQGK